MNWFITAAQAGVERYCWWYWSEWEDRGSVTRSFLQILSSWTEQGQRTYFNVLSWPSSPSSQSVSRLLSETTVSQWRNHQIWSHDCHVNLVKLIINLEWRETWTQVSGHWRRSVLFTSKHFIIIFNSTIKPKLDAWCLVPTFRKF